MKSKRKAICRRIGAAALAAALTFSLASCGKSSDGGTAEKKEWIWVPEFVTIDEENVSYYDMQLMGDSLCYLAYNWDEATQTSSQSICKYSLTDKNLTSVPLTWQTEGDHNLNSVSFGEDGSLYGVAYVYSEDFSDSQQYLCKFDAEGREVLYQDVTERFKDNYTDRVIVDGQGRIYISGDAVIWLFDPEGNYQGEVKLDTNGWIRSMGCGKDGKIYAAYMSNDGSSNSNSLIEIDFDGKKTGASYSNFPSGNGNRLVRGVDKDFLVQDGSKVYEYDMKSQTSEELFSWLDSDINGYNVQGYGVLEDGRIVVVNTDWESNDNSIALLTKTKASEVPQKETVTIATLGSGSSLQAAAVKFNKKSDKYHVDIREYADYSSFNGDDYETFINDALNRLNNDITSSNCPDIIDINSVDREQLGAKGVFEDLNGYLEKSSQLKRDDFLESVLNAYTVNGVLTGIPSSFQMQTVAAKASDVGAEMGWTIDEMIAYADAHPDAQLFDHMSKNQIMQYMMYYNADSFVDWNTGECHFDTDEFKKLLQFVNRFPDEVDYNSDEPSTPSKIQKGQVLLYEVSVYDFNEIEVCGEIFQNDYTLIGYPTTDGSVGCMLSGNGALGIATKSSHKEGAWTFIEDFLMKERSQYYDWGFPTRKAELQAMAEKAVEVEYITDENGEMLYDENGEPIVANSGGGFSYEDGWSFEYRIPTQEEVDTVLGLIDVARGVNNVSGSEILKIIGEEAEGFYKGQKSVDEVASVIQSRAKIYVGENN